MCRSGTDERRSYGSVLHAVLLRGVLLAVLALGSALPAAAGQFGALVSPGALSKAHAGLEGAGKCQSCHEVGRKVTAARCLTCHKPIAERIGRSVGVHRGAKECVSCHVEHAGVDAELRHLDTRTFNHAAETGFALDGQHAKTALKCVNCHKSRTFLDARASCSSCHADVHKGQFGADCTNCHSAKASFVDARKQFDHGKARFALTGAHTTVVCEKCHKSNVFRGLAFASCASCHAEPHRKKLGPTCTSCHSTQAWETRTVDHAKTGFVLVGAHVQVACAKCHQSGAMTKPVRADQCSSCHINVHRGSVKEDCRACHTEKTFQGAPFDHVAKTTFALEGKHEPLACRACHTSVSPANAPLARKVVDFSGLSRDCASCHREKDPHKGEFGQRCDVCHTPTTFNAKDFQHPRAPAFFAGRHEVARCEQCHLPGKGLLPVRTAAPPEGAPPKRPSMECATCHVDVHLGQVGANCEQCHGVDGAKFAPVRFAHERTSFTLTGKHQELPCAKCHRTETRPFPAGAGTAVVLRPLDTRCQSCHADPHLGQVGGLCETCHQTTTFALPSFAHRGMEDFFGGFHGKYACKDCHKVETGVFPAGRGTTTRFNVGRTCASCHRGF